MVCLYHNQQVLFNILKSRPKPGRADAFPARHYRVSKRSNKKMLPVFVLIVGTLEPAPVAEAHKTVCIVNNAISLF